MLCNSYTDNELRGGSAMLLPSLEVEMREEN